jgi:cytochrome c oxidase subunit II
MRSAGSRLATALPALVAVTGCTGWQSALDPQGPQSEHLSHLIWIFTGLSTVIWLAVMGVLLGAVVRRAPDRPDPLALHVPTERRSVMMVGGAVLGTLLTVIGLTALSYFSQRHLYAKEASAVVVKITGHQWWWDVQYEGDQPDQLLSTANELYIPAGEPIRVKLAASDVIHSFWVPNLMGKQDLIPGQDNELQFTATRPGVYRGQCAEFCGWQHAHMGMFAVVLPKDQFNSWRAAQTAPAIMPDDPIRQKGAAIFQSKACVMCHTIRGTSAGSRVGPDLTHFASRKSIASATLPMSRGNIAAWIVDPQGIKPGTNMPNVSLAPDEVDPLVSYLEGLR